MTIKDAKFGDKFRTIEFKTALFCGIYDKIALFYVEDVGEVQVFAENGKEIHGDTDNDIYIRP